MSNEKEEIGSKFTEKGETEVRSKIGVEGELPCILVYSERKHVDYIYPILSQFETILKKNGFKPLRLGDEIKSVEDYLSKLEMLIENCVLGVIILDGFRPNVLFEFGFLKGKNMPIILLQSEHALINVKTLYMSYKESGLTEKNFSMLKNPSINFSFHFSDFGGKHIAYFDWGASETDKKHPSIVLEDEIKKNRTQIEKVKLRNITKLWQH